jgi:hypothetical protein
LPAVVASGRTLGESRRQSDVIRGLNHLYGTNGRRRDSWTASGGIGRRNRGRGRMLLVLGAAGVILVGGAVVATTFVRVGLDVEGIDDGEALDRKDVDERTVRIESSGLAGDVHVEVNGTAVPVRAVDGGYVIRRQPFAAALVAGPNTLAVSVDGRFVLPDASVEREFTFDPAGPTVHAPAQVRAPRGGRLATLRGMVDDAVSLEANGQPIEIEEGGTFTIDFPTGIPRIELVARDADGNPARTVVEVARKLDRPAYPETAAVHVTAVGWADPAIRAPILAMIESGRVNTVELDIKDEAGEVGYDSTVPLAVTTGAAKGHYDARQAIDELHALGVRVVGRIVCFLDPSLAGWAWENDRPELLVLNGSGSAPLANNYGTAAFTNFANPEVRQYHIELAAEAVRLGFDEILYDYVRRPEGDLSAMQFAGLDVAPGVSVARFVAETDERLAEVDPDAMLGVSVFGVAATRPELIGQDIPLLAPQVDYVAPMVYPSHWGSGEYDVANPVRQPADIVRASVADFQRLVAGSGAAVVPWLQDFSSRGVEYDADEVRAQINAAAEVGARGFFLWNADSRYHARGMRPR